jgi:hypothetical protein
MRILASYCSPWVPCAGRNSSGGKRDRTRNRSYCVVSIRVADLKSSCGTAAKISPGVAEPLLKKSLRDKPRACHNSLAAGDAIERGAKKSLTLNVSYDTEIYVKIHIWEEGI